MRKQRNSTAEHCFNDLALQRSGSGGESNTASGFVSSVSGGSYRRAPGTENWAAGPLFSAN